MFFFKYLWEMAIMINIAARQSSCCFGKHDSFHLGLVQDEVTSYGIYCLHTSLWKLFYHCCWLDMEHCCLFILRLGQWNVIIQVNIKVVQHWFR